MNDSKDKHQNLFKSLTQRERGGRQNHDSAINSVRLRRMVDLRKARVFRRSEPSQKKMRD